jgi:uncharacterized protein (TIGR03083 family)
MAIPPEPPREYAPLFQLERNRLLELVRSLSPSDWERPTPCPGWNVLGLAAHLLGGDFTILASHRDQHYGTPAPEGIGEEDFIGWLDELQVEWVRAARRLSPRLVIDLLDWAGPQIIATVKAQDPAAVAAHVPWASTTLVPVWLDQARELSERWIHRQQILQSLWHPSDLRPDLAEPVMDGLRWAYPFRLALHRRPRGATVEVSVAGQVDLHWNIVSDSTSWAFHPAPGDSLVAKLGLTSDQAWRLLTNNFDPAVQGELSASGDPSIIATLLRTRAIIGTPK